MDTAISAASCHLRLALSCARLGPSLYSHPPAFEGNQAHRTLESRRGKSSRFDFPIPSPPDSEALFQNFPVCYPN